MRQLLARVRWAVATIDLAVIIGMVVLLAGGILWGWAIAHMVQ